MKIKVNILFGTLLGLTIGFLIVGFWRNKFDWEYLIVTLIVGAMAHLLMAFIDYRKKQSSW